MYAGKLGPIDLRFAWNPWSTGGQAELEREHFLALKPNLALAVEIAHSDARPIVEWQMEIPRDTRRGRNPIDPHEMEIRIGFALHAVAQTIPFLKDFFWSYYSVTPVSLEPEPMITLAPGGESVPPPEPYDSNCYHLVLWAK